MLQTMLIKCWQIQILHYTTNTAAWTRCRVQQWWPIFYDPFFVKILMTDGHTEMTVDSSSSFSWKMPGWCLMSLSTASLNLTVLFSLWEIPCLKIRSVIFLLFCLWLWRLQHSLLKFFIRKKVLQALSSSARLLGTLSCCSPSCTTQNFASSVALFAWLATMLSIRGKRSWAAAGMDGFGQLQLGGEWLCCEEGLENRRYPVLHDYKYLD